ncbi:MAG: cereblon family protein [Spirochaetes bacterium]|nr:cereblon family protein [Spirochaetota bacterium]
METAVPERNMDKGHAFYRLKTPDGMASPENNADESAGMEYSDGKGRRIFCAACGNTVTHSGKRISINGLHRHVFTNPGGYTFEIGCFITAEGCAITGDPTDEFTWFPGYRWAYALCSGCLSHLGWHYRSGAGAFFGLILDSLKEE